MRQRLQETTPHRALGLISRGDLEVVDSVECHGPQHLILPPELMRISTVETTNVQSAPAKSDETRRSGLVTLAGPSFIWDVSSSGRQTRKHRQGSKLSAVGLTRARNHGDVQAAIFRKRPSISDIHVGVVKIMIPDLSLGFRHTHVARPVEKNGLCQRSALMDANYFAMPALVLPAHRWAPSSPVSVESRNPERNVPTPTTTLDGAVIRPVARACPAAITNVCASATRAFAVLAKSASTLVAIVARKKSQSYAAIGTTRSHRNECIQETTAKTLWNLGTPLSLARTFVSVRLTAANTLVSDLAIRPRRPPLTALNLQTWLRTVLAGRLISQTFWNRRGPLVKTRFPIAH